MRLRGVLTLALLSCSTFTSTSSPPADGGTQTIGGDAAVRASGPAFDRTASASCGWKPFDDGFEHRATLVGDWSDDHALYPTVTLSISGEQSAHGDTSLLVDVAPDTDYRNRYLVHDLDPGQAATATCVDVHAYVLIESIGGNTRPLSIDFGTKTLFVRLEVAAGSPNDVRVELREQWIGETDATPNYATLVSGDFLAGKWIDLGIHVEKGPPLMAALVIDGNVKMGKSPTILLAGDIPAEVHAGCAYATKDPARYFIDDVSIR